MDFTLTPELAFLLGAAVFWILLYVVANVFHLDKHGLEVKPGYFMYKSKALNSYLDKAANKWPTLWLALSNIGVAFSIGLMVLSIYFLANNLLRFFLPPIGQASPVFPAIPVLFIRLYWLPYFFFAAAIIILTHELAHGIVARLEGIPVLSTGVLAFLLIFGAFVEPDEKEFEKVPILSRLRMLAAGSSTNLVAAILFLLLVTGLFAPPSGLLIQEVVPDGPAYTAGLRQWDVIKAIDGNLVQVPLDFSRLMSNVTPGTTVSVIVLQASREIPRNITTEADPDNSSRAILGIVSSFSPYRQNLIGLDQYTGINLYWSLFWTYLLGVSVAIFNMLPAYPFDGERVLYYPLATLVKKRKRELRWALSGFAYGLFILNIVLSFLIFGLRSI